MFTITSKQRATLRGMANELPVILYVGKDGVTDATAREADAALKARELIKGCVQRGAPLSAREACDALCARVDAQPVQCIGSRFVLYRMNDEDPQIVI